MMKKILLSLALLASTNHFLLPNETNQNTVPSLSWSENQQLGNLYQIVQRDPFLARYENVDFDYYLTILDKHIKIIEHKIQTKATWQSDTQLKGALFLTGAMSLILVGGITYFAFSQLYTGKYKTVLIPAALLKTVPSLKFTRAEKKKLDRISVEKPTILYKDIFDQYSHRKTINSFTNADLEKLDYLSRRLALKEAYNTIFIGGGLSLFIATVMSYFPIHNALHYSEYLEKQLKNDQEIYAHLLEEKIRRQVSFRAGLTPTDPDRAKRLASMEV